MATAYAKEPSPEAPPACEPFKAPPPPPTTEAVRVCVFGLLSTACCTRIEGCLRRQRGIVSADVSLEKRDVVVEFDPSVTTTAHIARVITTLGYRAVPHVQEAHVPLVVEIGDASPELVKQQLRQVDGVLATHDHTKDDPSDAPGNSVLVEYDPSCIGARELVQQVSDAIGGAPVTVSAPRPHAVVSEELEVARYRRLLITSVLLAVPVLVFDYVVPLLGANVQSACSREIFRGFSWENLVGVICATPILFYIALPIHESAFLALRYGSRVTMDVLISLSSFSAYIFSVVTVVLRATGVLPALAGGAKDETFFEVTVMLVTLIVLGRYIETIVKAKAAHSVDAVLNLQAKAAILIQQPSSNGSNGSSRRKSIAERSIDVQLVERGDLLRVLPGTRVPTDGVVVEGESSIDESMITGEARKVTKKVGSAVIGGTINAQGVLVMRVTHTINESMLARIVSLVDEAQASKSVSQSVADVVSSYFTVFIIVVAVSMFVVWYELARLGKIDTQGWSPFPFALRFALTILVISCPCAISLAVPTAIMVGTTMGSKSGVLFKGGRALEALDKVDIVLFDKTGTLTTGQVQVVSIYAAASFSGAVTGEAKTQALLKLWTNLEAAERNSEHPIGRAIVRRANTMKIEHLDVTDFEALPGHGVRCQVDGRPVCVGSVKWIRDDLHLTIPVDLVKRNDAYQAEGRIVVCLAVDGVVLGLVALQDATRPEAKAVVQQLCERNIGTWIVTGDQQKTALTLANELYITDDAVVANATTEDKVKKVRELQATGKRVAFIGDGEQTHYFFPIFIPILTMKFQTPPKFTWFNQEPKTASASMLRLSSSVRKRAPALHHASGSRLLVQARTKVSRTLGPRFETPAVLEFEDGSRYPGVAFGAKKSMAGEVVFTTGMVGYPEALTDPSFKGQILNMTFPMIGNYGVPCTKTLDEFGLNKYIESDRIHAAGMIVQDYSSHHSHWNAQSSLSDWLEREGIPGIAGVDTRAITKKIRAKGAMKGRIIVEGSDSPNFVDVNQTNLVAQVSTKEVRVFGKGNPLKILAVDCGIKYNIIRSLVSRGAEVKLVPWNYDISKEKGWYDGLFISNGPGDPAMLTETTEHLRRAMNAEGDDVKPIFGICLGNQLLGRAAGAPTYKLPFGNRGHNQPVNNLKTGQSYITSQNHGYALDGKKLPSEWEELFVNSNDGTNEGIIHKSKPYFTAQFHPEHMGGPTDTEFLFDVFLDAVRNKEKGPISSLVQRPEVIRPQVKKVLVLGSGGLSIGQAGEFDYSGSQAIKALKEENIETILINPNIASVQTNIDRSSEAQASNVYYLPVNADFVEQVIKRERPDGILISMGGQTALNCGVELHEKGVLQKYGVQVLGTQIDVVNATEDRDIFNMKLKEIGEKIAESHAVNSVEDAVDAAKKIGFPVMIRSAFALGGLGSGLCDNEEELRAMAKKAFAGSPQILVERSMKGWKEVEYEVVRDSANNCLTVCNMENFDPLGIHTGDSMVIAPSQTLSNREYHMLRETALKVVRHLGIVGECNIQYALNPESEEYCIIEVNARLSRSSALASKATGYPLAFVAAKLALGITLPELKNSVTKSTTACFEPSLDYCVAKIPRWDLSKFENVSTEIGSSMKSVGEVMSIARNFEEAMQKAMRMVEPSIEGFEPRGDTWTKEELIKALGRPTDKRIYQIAYALKNGILNVEEVHDITKIDTWWLNRLQGIADLDVNLSEKTLDTVTKEEVLHAKKIGFSDRQLARMLKATDDAVRAKRKSFGIEPSVKQIDTLAAEYPAQTNYLYMTYNGQEHDVPAQDPNNGVMVLGSGAYRIGSSVEFDWCAVSCIRTLRKLGRRAVMLNYNPETVSTDYDECDQLYFEELSKERVMDVYDREGVQGVVVSVGGQIPNNLALPLHKAGVNIMGTHPTMIDNAEDRYKFSKLMDEAGVRQPQWKELTSIESAKQFANNVGYPCLVRPSYVLSGAAMNVAYNDEDLAKVLGEAADVSPEHPVVITKFIEGAKELELDAVAKDGVVIAAAISEHVENAGVHSGDATLILPPVEASSFYINEIRKCGEKIAKALNISGPFNAQFLAKGADVSVIECNLRASRSFPFVSKTTGADFINAATKVMVGESTENDNLPPLFGPKRPEGFVGIKSPMFSYTRLGGADPLLGVEMASTGEVACFGKDRHEAFLKALISSNFKLPKKNILLSMQDKFTEDFVHAAFKMHELGYNLYTTEKTHEFLNKYDIPSTKVGFPLDEDNEENVLHYLREKKIDLVVNLPNSESKQIENNYLIRRTAVDFSIPLLTNISLVKLFVEAMAIHKEKPLLGLDADSLFDYYQRENREEKAWTDVHEFH